MLHHGSMNKWIKLANKLRSELSDYPNFNITWVEDEGLIKIHGIIKLNIGNNTTEFEVEIILNEDYPYLLPHVRELRNRIPWEKYRHVNEDGTLCFGINAEIREYFHIGEPINVFIEKILYPYFLEQWNYEITGKFQKELVHGTMALYNYYSKLFTTTDFRQIILLLNAIYQQKIKGHLPCNCNSGLITRDCHGKVLIELSKKISPQQALKDLLIFKELLSM